MCHMSCVACHMSRVTSHVSTLNCKYIFLDSVLEHLGEGLVSTEPTPSSFVAFNNGEIQGDSFYLCIDYQSI